MISIERCSLEEFRFLSTLSLRRATILSTIYRISMIFLSTLSLRRATQKYINSRANHIISIHALLAESDAIRKRQVVPVIQFLSTLSLRRATGGKLILIIRQNNFYPRSPCGERPIVPVELIKLVNISIHALLAESDSTTLTFPGFGMDFYPRSPCGERQFKRWCVRNNVDISIHALLAESDHIFSDSVIIFLVFLSTLSLRRATILFRR